MRQGVAILGSTGTIGTFTLEIVRQFPDRFNVVSLAAGKNIPKLRQQIVEFRPRLVSISDRESISALRSDFPDIDFYSDDVGLTECISAHEVDTVVVGIVGFAALKPALEAVRLKKRVAMANKESLVTAGSLFRQEVERSGCEFIPVDSEHNALFQLLRGFTKEEVESVVLTASGGPLLKKPGLPLEEVTPAIAVKHPNWNMGPKISVDSATLMNKGLEVIEAHYLFGIPIEKIEVWVHPQSIVHGAIWLKDNSCVAQMTVPDMRCSIGYALGFPGRMPAVVRRPTLAEMANLEFLPPDLVRFPCLRLAQEALRMGQDAVIALNAANELVVEAFLKGQVLFPQIPKVIERTLAEFKRNQISCLDDVFAQDVAVRQFVSGRIL